LRAASSPGTIGVMARLGCDMGRSFVASVANLKRARALVLDDDLAVQRAQFDLKICNISDSNRSAF